MCWKPSVTARWIGRCGRDRPRDCTARQRQFLTNARKNLAFIACMGLANIPDFIMIRSLIALTVFSLLTLAAIAHSLWIEELPDNAGLGVRFAQWGGTNTKSRLATSMPSSKSPAGRLMTKASHSSLKSPKRRIISFSAKSRATGLLLPRRSSRCASCMRTSPLVRPSFTAAGSQKAQVLARPR